MVVDQLEAARDALDTEDEDDPEYDAAQYVTFEMAGEAYALPMGQVREIVRVPELIRVPLGPPALHGVANLRGRVLPVLCLRMCCGLASTEWDDTSRVVVVDAMTHLVGLVVDRVTSVVSVDPGAVEQGASVRGALRSDVLAGVLRTPLGMVTVLDVVQVLQGPFPLLGQAGGEHPAAHAGFGVTVAGAGVGPEDPAAVWWASGGVLDEDGSDAVELVSFTLDGQEYALPMEQVREIVQAPESISRVPNASDRVIGVMDLRGRLLPVLSMRRILGMPEEPIAATDRIVVVSVGDRLDVGVVTDAVREVLRVPNGLVDPLPNTVAASGRAVEVEAVCRLEDGARLVSVLSLGRMLDLPDLGGDLADYGHSGAGPAAVSAPQAHDDLGVDEMDDEERDEELLVVFRLDTEQYAVDVDRVQEIIRVPETLIKVPNAQRHVDGLVNLRGAVLPVVDLRTRLGLPRLAADERQRIVVFANEGVRTGYIVDSVVEVTRVPSRSMESAPELSGGAAAVVSKVANLVDQHRVLLVVDADQLLLAA